MVVTFCGHSEVYQQELVSRWLDETVERLILQGADMFLLGGYGVFDGIACGVVWNMKKKYPHIQSVLILPYLDKKVDVSKYDGTTYPPIESVPKRYAISHRNRWMVEQAEVVVSYVTHSWGGAAATLQYAIKRKKRIIFYGGADEKGCS